MAVRAGRIPGYHFDLADVAEGVAVLDLGSGSGTDVFVAALYAGESGSVTGLDVTDEQLEKARALRDEAGADTVSFEKGYVEDLPFEDGRFDVVVSNGVINRSAEKERVSHRAPRVSPEPSVTAEPRPGDYLGSASRSA